MDMLLAIVFLLISITICMENPNALKLVSKEEKEYNVPRHVAFLRSPMIALLLSIKSKEALQQTICFSSIGSEELSLIAYYLNQEQEKSDIQRQIDPKSKIYLFYKKKVEMNKLSTTIGKLGTDYLTFARCLNAADFLELPDLLKELITFYANQFKNCDKQKQNEVLSLLSAPCKRTLLQECYLLFDTILSEHPPEFTCSKLVEHRKIMTGYRESDSEFAIAKKWDDIDLSGIKLVVNRPGIFKLNIKNQGLTVPPDLAALKDLRQLNLADNQLREPPKISCCPELRRLYMAHNSLTKLPKLLWNVRLTHLDLSRNQLTHIPDLAILTSLRCLHLSHNKLKKLPSLRHLIHLEWLTVDNNNLTRLPVLPEGLSSIDVSMNYLSDKELRPLETSISPKRLYPQKIQK